MRTPWPTRFARPEVTRLTPECDLPTRSSRSCGTANSTASVTSPSATSATSARRPQTTEAATTIPAASAMKLDCEKEMSRPSQVATTTTYSPAIRQPRTPPSRIPASEASTATVR